MTESIKDSEAFDIRILDNFLPSEVFKEMHKFVDNLEWSSKDNRYTKDLNTHWWFGSLISEEDVIRDIVKDNIKKFNKEIIKFHFATYTLVAEKKAFVHRDYDPKYQNSQLIVYLKGDDDIHGGTGFYIKKENEYILNTHIGFKENRAIFFNAGIYHSPLLWNSTINKSRISMVYQLMTKDL